MNRIRCHTVDRWDARGPGRWSLSVLAAWSCTSLTTAPPRPLELRVLQDTVYATSTVTSVAAVIPLLLTNSSRQRVFFTVTCGVTLERLVDGEWRGVWSQVCVQGSPPLSLQSGGQLQTSIEVFAIRGGSPALLPGFVSGTYRIALPSGAGSAEGEIQVRGPVSARASPAFALIIR
jgi:hypothetical protein